MPGTAEQIKNPVHRARWQAFTDATMELLRNGELDVAMIREVLDCADNHYDEQEAGRAA